MVWGLQSEDLKRIQAGSKAFLKGYYKSSYGVEDFDDDPFTDNLSYVDALKKQTADSLLPIVRELTAEAVTGEIK